MSITGIQVITDKTKNLEEALLALTSKSVYVGIPMEKNRRKDEPIVNAALGYIHERGVPEKNIPARPFLVPGIEAAQGQIAKHFEVAGKAALRGDMVLMDRCLNAAGLEGRASVIGYITEGVPPPLAPATIAARQRRGRKSEKPLIDTGQLRAAVTYVIREG